MPETPEPKERPHPWRQTPSTTPALTARDTAPAYAELQTTTNFTFLTGASHPDELIRQAAALGYRALAITDTNTLAGIVRAHVAAKEVDMPLVVGCRVVMGGGRHAGTEARRHEGRGESGVWEGASGVGEQRQVDSELLPLNSGLRTPDSGLPPPLPPACLRASVPACLSVLLYPTNRAAYGRLCRLLTLGKRRAPKGQCHLTLHDVIEYQQGLLAVLEPPRVLDQGCIDVVTGLRAVFDDERISLAASCPYGPDDRGRLAQLAALSRHTDVPLVATNDVHYHVPARRALQDVVTCIRLGCTLAEAGLRLCAHAERYLKPPAEIARLLADYPQALTRSVDIARRAAAFSLDELRYEYPNDTCPVDTTPMSHLIELTRHGARQRYPDGVPEKVRRLLEHEFALIDELNYAPYFLTVHDLVVYARSREILCQGRGAAANSAVCYCLGITAVDPERIDLLFERFVSRQRNEPPDIDIDFEHERREEVIQYIYQKYGRERAALTAEVITYRGRSAVRDVGKALGLSLDGVDRLAKELDWHDGGRIDPQRLAALGPDPDDPTIATLSALVRDLVGFPRHLSQHVGGFVITRGPLCETVPIENAAMPDRTVIEWDKDDIDAMGILKVDCLGLGMLTCVRKALGMIGGRHAGTQARRHVVQKIQKLARRAGSDDTGEHHGTDKDLSRFDCVGAGDGIGAADLSSHGPDAGSGALRIDQPDEAGGSVGAVQYRRGIRPTKHDRLHQVPARSPGVTRRVDAPTRTGSKSADAGPRPTDSRATQRNGSGTAGPDPQPGAQDPLSPKGRDNQITSCLRAGVPPMPSACLSSPSASSSPPPPACLRACVPPCLSFSSIPPEDPAVYDMICNADTIGVFQIESRAQMSMLPRLRPRCFYDLVIEVAIVRPGPIQGQMVHPYLRRRNGEEAVSYPDAKVKQVLGKTLGVPLFQEQAMQLAIVAAGFTPDEADQLRRAIGAWKSKEKVIFTFGERLMEGMVANGYDRGFAARCFEQIKGFSEYGFPESHAASFALIVYVSAWLKCHYPAAFAAALINSQPMGFYAPAQIVGDAKAHGVDVRPIDVNFSSWDCVLERHEGTEARRHEGGGGGGACPALRLGMRLVKGLRQDDANAIAQAVANHGRFGAIDALWRVSGVPAQALRKLADADAFSSMGLDRQHALWHIRDLHDPALPLFEQEVSATECLRACVPACLPSVPAPAKVVKDYLSMGLSLKAHPVSFLRDRLDGTGATRAVELQDEARWPGGAAIAVAGVVLVRQRPRTASGVVFMTLEDETGIANLICRPEIFERYRKVARHGIVVLARGCVERQGQVVHVMVSHMEDLSAELRQLACPARNFH